MRITPNICWSCHSWFLPKTKRPTKYCCNACRQQGFQSNSKRKGGLLDDVPIKFSFPDGVGVDEFMRMLGKYKDNCNHSYNISCEDKGVTRSVDIGCIKCWFENNYDEFCRMTYLYGRDQFMVSAKEYLASLKSETL